MLDSNLLVAELADEMRLCSLANCSNPQFTARLKERSSDFCRRSGVRDPDILYTRSANEESSERKHEFLVDFCAFAQERMVLALESEWVPRADNIFFDFRKLLHLKTPLKVMVCDSPTFVSDELASVAKFLAAYPDHRIGEEYIIFNYRGGQATIHCHRWKPGRDGAVKLEEVRLALVEGFPKSTR